MKLYKDGQLVGELSTTELKELAGVDIEKAAEVAFEAVEVKNFEVGDKVEVVGVSVTGRDECIGETAVITYIDEEGDIQLVEGDGNHGWYPPSSLKLIEEEPEEVLSYENVKVGELFEVVNNVAQKKFPVGNVVRLMDSLLNDEHSSKFEDVVSGEVGFSTYKEIKRHTHEVLSEDNVKEGEYFVITDNNGCHRFEIGEVVKAGSGRYPLGFTALNADSSEACLARYTDVRRATTEEIAEATKPKEVKLKIDDVVKVDEHFAKVIAEIDSDGDYKLKRLIDGAELYREPAYFRHATEEEKSHLQT